MKAITDYNRRSRLFSVRKANTVVICLLSFASVTAQQKVIPLHKGVAPGSENWDWAEKETNKNPVNTTLAYNVTNPTLTLFTPDPTVANGSAIIICPGGGLCVLNVGTGGAAVANELIKKGITVFMLKYRLVHMLTDDPYQEAMNISKDSVQRARKVAPVAKLAQDDLRVAMIYIRQHANEFNVDTNRIGILGFSAGASLAIDLAYNYTSGTRPAFIAAMFTQPKKGVIKDDAPKMFIATSANDPSPAACIRFYNEWIASTHSAELHIFSDGGHGRPGFPNPEIWIARFEQWLATEGFLTPK